MKSSDAMILAVMNAIFCNYAEKPKKSSGLQRALTSININFKWHVNCVTANPVTLLPIFMVRLAFCIHSEATCAFVII